MRIVIIGGGYLGQLLHTILPKARVLDWRPVAPTEPARSFGPQYLWTPMHHLPCVSFPVITQVDGRTATETSVFDYKKKVGKEQDASDWRTQFREHTTGYDVTLPPDRVEYGMRIASIDTAARMLIMANEDRIAYDWLISTIPMPSLIALCRGMEPPKEGSFESRAIYVSVEPAVELSYLHVNYISDPSTSIYRETIRNGQKHVESLHPWASEYRLQRLLPGKIYATREAFVYRAMLRTYKILPVGRYGAWNPEELAHETVEEIRNWKMEMGL